MGNKPEVGEKNTHRNLECPAMEGLPNAELTAFRIELALSNPTMFRTGNSLLRDSHQILTSWNRVFFLSLNETTFFHDQTITMATIIRKTS